MRGVADEGRAQKRRPASLVGRTDREGLGVVVVSTVVDNPVASAVQPPVRPLRDEDVNAFVRLVLMVVARDGGDNLVEPRLERATGSRRFRRARTLPSSPHKFGSI